MVLNCHFRGEHIQSREDAKHVGSHMRLLQAAVQAQGGNCLREVYHQFWRELKAQPDWTAPSAGILRYEVMVLAVCVHGRHKSEACLWLAMWNWARLGGGFSLADSAKPYNRLCSQCWNTGMCGFSRCPQNDICGCDGRMASRRAEDNAQLWRAAKIFDEVAQQELELDGPPDFRSTGLDELG